MPSDISDFYILVGRSINGVFFLKRYRTCIEVCVASHIVSMR